MIVVSKKRLQVLTIESTFPALFGVIIPVMREGTMIELSENLAFLVWSFRVCSDSLKIPRLRVADLFSETSESWIAAFGTNMIFGSVRVWPCDCRSGFYWIMYTFNSVGPITAWFMPYTTAVWMYYRKFVGAVRRLEPASLSLAPSLCDLHISMICELLQQTLPNTLNYRGRF